MSHPSDHTDVPKARRIKVDQLPPPNRSPGEMLALLSKIVNRQVDKLNTITLNGAVDLPPGYSEELDQVLDRVIKLSREERMNDTSANLTSLSDTQLLELKSNLEKKNQTP